MAERSTAQQYAQQHRQGSDWFGHDSSAGVQDAGHHGRGVGQFADKNKGESEDWYHYDAAATQAGNGDAPKQPSTPPQLEKMDKLDLNDSFSEGMTHAESHERARKGKGLSENWYSHTNYGDGMTKAERNKATAKEEKQHVNVEDSEPAGKAASSNDKNGQGAPDWYYHDGHGDKVVSPTRHTKRSNPNNPRTDDYKAGAWFSHDNLDGKQQNVDHLASPRVKPEGQQYAERNRGSGNWMTNSGSAPMESPRGKAVSAQKYKDSVGSVLHMQSN